MPLDECKDDFIEEILYGSVRRIQGGKTSAADGITVRLTHVTYPELVFSGTSDYRGDVDVAIPRTAFSAQSYKLEVLDGNNKRRFVRKVRVSFYFFRVTVDDDAGTVSVCKWINDDECEDF